MLYARQLLFIFIIQEDPKVMSADEKARFILEITGNIMLRPKTAKRLRSKISALIDICGNEANRDEEEHNGLGHEAWFEVDLSKLKYKELDGLEAIYRLWRNDDGFNVDMKEVWRQRVYQLLQQQAENMDGVFDLDYQFKLVERGGGNISILEYQTWRKDGMAYDLSSEDSIMVEQATVPNMCLASSIKATDSNGDRMSHKGYHGDIVTGPFITYGLDYSQTALPVDQTRTSKPSQQLAIQRLTSSIENIHAKMDETASKHDLVKISFLPLVCDRELGKGQMYADRYHLCFIASSVTHQMSIEFADNIKPGGLVMAETPLYLLHMTKEIQEKFKEHLENLVEQCEMTITDYDVLKTSVCRLYKK